MWVEMIKNHIDLSESYAAAYDSEYGSIVTKNYMDYEKSRINTAVNLLEPNSRILAVDVGCGTGRYTFELSKYFNNVIGLDFSSKMLQIAQKNAENLQLNNIDFFNRDVSTYGLGDFSFKVSMLNFAFGMGSFFEDIDYLICEVKRVLLKSGVLHITFYNEESFVCKLSSLIDMGVSALPLPDIEQLIVNDFQIPCKFYSPIFIRQLFNSHFMEVYFSTYPSILPLIKEKALLNPNILKFCTELDNQKSHGNNGYYISAIYKNK